MDAVAGTHTHSRLAALGVTLAADVITSTLFCWGVFVDLLGVTEKSNHLTPFMLNIFN